MELSDLDADATRDLTITIKYKPNMVIALVFANMETRNYILSGLKLLVSEAQLELENPLSAIKSSVVTPTHQDAVPGDSNDKCTRLMAQVCFVLACHLLKSP
jgi:hypothetical protein